MYKGTVLGFCFLLCACVLFAGCEEQASSHTQVDTKTEEKSDQRPDEKVLRMNLRLELPTADPAFAEDSTSVAVIRATFDGLTRMGKDGKPQLSVAEKVDVSKDQLMYTFHLRDSTWSNGDPVTAHDFEYAWKRVLNPQTTSINAYQMFYLKNGEKFNNGEVTADEVGVKALDDKTLVVKLENPTPYFLELTAYFTYYPVNPKVIEANAKWSTEANTHVGNGPFKIEKWDHKIKLVLAKNDTYWDKNAVNLDRVDFSIIEDENTELFLFEKDELDWAGSPLSTLPIEAMPSLNKSGKMTTQTIAATYLYKFNTEQVPFNNVKIRKAFSYAINRQLIIDHIKQGNQEPALGFLPPSMSVNTGPYFQDNNVEVARQLLKEGIAELGLSKLPSVTLSFNSSPSHRVVAEAIQDQWNKAFGIEVKLENKDWKVFLEDQHLGNYQISRSGWMADFNDPITFLEIFRDKEVGNNDTGWENARYEALLRQSAKERDPQKRMQLLGQAEHILMNEMPIAPIFFYTNSWVKNERVKDVFIDGLGNLELKWADIVPQIQEYN
ncbi:peptide ABC transporter substrate-binding protein [Brevibacillus invocatus]|uniref:peptide ABC transporter substrate-binding protein n=1 Tax=Brevibacillus invocatus TaxID=173959 RepID=UPI0020414DFA|nr:peptide ABC transporter substrate-binding protein [Brevibacillus invocatus]MCM3430147.1 peptide ABC transporter substrate-binding protein [Brevibacillus invocatus]